ncbi:mobile mystery protein A [Alphaproteobacteria bacterium]|nr:mobile mystery protein A [Alphaproteobacteria bacterium]
MKKEQREVARRFLSYKTKKIRAAVEVGRPAVGWVRAIRESLGMTSRQLARRMNISQPSLSALEKREKQKTLTLASLETAARALNCRLYYALIPNDSLEVMVRRQATKMAMRRLRAAIQTMELENQHISKEEARLQLEQHIEAILHHSPTKLWDEENHDA